MQKSGIFVVYCDIPIDANDAPTPANVKQTHERSYHATYDSKVYDRIMTLARGGFPVTRQLVHAAQFDKANAFRTAINMGGTWAAGELISDKNGVRVEE